MARKVVTAEDGPNKEMSEHIAIKDEREGEVDQLNRLLAAVLTYLSDDEVEEIDIEYLLNNTEGLREWWNQYREKNRKKIESEIKKSLSELPLKDLEKIRDQIKEKKR